MTAVAEARAAACGAGRGAEEPADEFSRQLGRWLRAARQLRGWSLADVEKLSGGRFRAGALRTYETADRHMDPETLTGLAAFYRVPVTLLLP